MHLNKILYVLYHSWCIFFSLSYILYIFSESAAYVSIFGIGCRVKLFFALSHGHTVHVSKYAWISWIWKISTNWKNPRIFIINNIGLYK